MTEINVVVVQNYKCLLRFQPRKVNRELVFEMKDGIAMYHHTLWHEKDYSNTKIYYPQMHMAFDIQYDPFTHIPMGLYQISGNLKAYRPVLPGESKIYDSLPDTDTIHMEDFTCQERDDIIWAKDPDKYEQGGPVTRCDGNFIVWMLGRITKVWRFSGTAETLSAERDMHLMERMEGIDESDESSYSESDMHSEGPDTDL